MSKYQYTKATAYVLTAMPCLASMVYSQFLSASKYPQWHIVHHPLYGNTKAKLQDLLAPLQFLVLSGTYDWTCKIIKTRVNCIDVNVLIFTVRITMDFVWALQAIIQKSQGSPFAHFNKLSCDLHAGRLFYQITPFLDGLFFTLPPPLQQHISPSPLSVLQPWAFAKSPFS